MSIHSFPPELFSAILLHVPPKLIQQTVLSLSRALPNSPISLRPLFHSIRIVYPDQAVSLYNRLRSWPVHDSSQASSWICKFSIETWTVDAEVAVNLIGLLQNVESLSLWIGPTNFAPEHLEEIFSNHMSSLKYLSLRFKPYREKANYFQFHKGAYFDSTLSALSAWPSSPTTISIIQDPPSALGVFVHRKEHAFAQPIIFHQFDLRMSQFIHSPSSVASLKSLQIQFPARRTVPPLTGTSPYIHASSPSPPMEFLDLSRCCVTDSDLDALLLRFGTLKHLVLDHCSNMRDTRMMSEDLAWWSAIGKTCALTGSKRAREREKTLKAWLEAQRSNDLLASVSDQAPALPQAPRARPGRKGLATAQISLRDPAPTPAASTSRGHPRIRVFQKIYIIPPTPTLRSLSISPSPVPGVSDAFDTETLACIVTAFTEGWVEGLRVLQEHRSRLVRTLLRKSDQREEIMFLKFKNSQDTDGEKEGFQGLEDVGQSDENAFIETNREGALISMDTPVLCLSGFGQAGHVDGCGHSVASGIWLEEHT